MEEDIIQENDVQSEEYREMMEAQLAKDFWFMCEDNKRPSYFEQDDDKAWAAVCFPMEWGNGWLYSFFDLCRELLTEVKSDFQWAQLKEKFGGARCYYSGTVTPYGEELIRQFEVDMESTCEVCGKPAKLRTDGWWMALCDECYKKSQEGYTE